MSDTIYQFRLKDNNMIATYTDEAEEYLDSETTIKLKSLYISTNEISSFVENKNVRDDIDYLWEEVLTEPKQIKKEGVKKSTSPHLEYKETLTVIDYDNPVRGQSRPIQVKDIVFARKIDLTKIQGYQNFYSSFSQLPNRQYINEVSKRFNQYYIWLDSGSIRDGIRHIFRIKANKTSHFIDYPLPAGLSRTILNVLLSIFETLKNPKYLKFEEGLELCNGSSNLSLIYNNDRKIKTVIEVSTGRINNSYKI